MASGVHTSLRAFLLVAGGVYAVLVIAVAILPAASLERAYPPGDPDDLNALVARGRDLYRSYGCVTCHTQQVRGDERLAYVDDAGETVVPVLRPDRRFGLDRASRAEDYQHDDPPFMGTQRTGPDLTNVGARISSPDWHYWHLYAPRVVSPDSVMPGLPWLFRTEVDRIEGEDDPVAPLEALEALGVPGGRIWATPDAQALVEYILSLRPAERAR